MCLCRGCLWMWCTAFSPSSSAQLHLSFLSSLSSWSDCSCQILSAKAFFFLFLKLSLPSTLLSCTQVIANAPAAGLYCFVLWKSPSVILVVLSGDICGSPWILWASIEQSGSRQTCVQWRCRLVAQQRWSRRKRLHGWKAVERSSAPGWCSHSCV